MLKVQWEGKTYSAFLSNGEKLGMNWCLWYLFGSLLISDIESGELLYLSCVILLARLIFWHTVLVSSFSLSSLKFPFDASVLLNHISWRRFYTMETKNILKAGISDVAYTANKSLTVYCYWLVFSKELINVQLPLSTDLYKYVSPLF